MAEPRRYEFGSATEDGTVLIGLRGTQLAVAGSGLAAAVVAVRVGVPWSVPAAATILCMAGALAFWHIGGRTPEQWAPVAISWLVRRLRRRTCELSQVPLVGHGPDGQLQQHPPATLANARILAAPVDHASAHEVGVIADRQAGTWAAVLSCRGRSFQLADLAEKQRRLASWGSLLAGLARSSSPISRLQWVERTVPDDGDAMGRYLAANLAVPTDHASLASYLSLVDQAGPAAPKHETFLVVAISAARGRRAIRQAGGGDRGAAKVLLRELGSLQRKLASTDVVVDGLLQPRALAAAIRTAYDPTARPGLARRAAAAGEEAGTDPANAWPLATETTWSAYRSGEMWHTTYWVAQWPRSPVGADFLTPLLLGTTVMRTVSLTMEPISPLRAHREVEQAVVKRTADDELRTRAGFATSARRRRTSEDLQRREQELADGHADYRLAGYVTVTAPSLEELEGACGEVEQAAQQAHLELRRLHGQQDQAFTFTVPLARGLP